MTQGYKVGLYSSVNLLMNIKDKCTGCYDNYSRTCEEQPPRGKCKSGCSLQVVALRRFSCWGHESELCVLYPGPLFPYVLQTKHL